MITDPESWRIAMQSNLKEEHQSNFWYLQLKILIDLTAEIASLSQTFKSIDSSLDSISNNQPPFTY